MENAVVRRETTTIRESKATRRRSTTRRAVKREAAMPEIAEPYRDDIAISRRSQSCGVEDSKPTNIRKGEPTKECSTMEKTPEAHRGSQSHQTIAAPPKDGDRASAAAGAAAS